MSTGTQPCQKDLNSNSISSTNSPLGDIGGSVVIDVDVDVDVDVSAFDMHLICICCAFALSRLCLCEAAKARFSEIFFFLSNSASTRL